MNSKHIIFAASVLSVSLVMTACSDDVEHTERNKG